MIAKAILIDCDGTAAVNAEGIHEEAVRHTLHNMLYSQGRTMDDENFKTCWTAELGKGIANFFNAYAGQLPQEHKEALKSACAGGADEFEGIYEKHYCDFVATGLSGLKVRKGLGSLIVQANDQNIPVAFISNAKQAILEATVSALQLKGRVELIAGMDTVMNAGFAPKPAAGSYIFGCQLLNVDPVDCIGFEDTKSGVQSLVAAGVGTVVFCRNDMTMLVDDYVSHHSHVLIEPDDCMRGVVNEHFANRAGRGMDFARVAAQGPSF